MHLGCGRFGLTGARPVQPGPQRRVVARAIGLGRDGPVTTLLADGHPRAPGHGRFQTHQRQYHQLDLAARVIVRRLQRDAHPTGALHIGDQGRKFGRADPLGAAGGPKGDAETGDAGPRGAQGILDQRHFGAFLQPRPVARHLQQLDPVADRPQRRDQVMAQPRADQRHDARRQIGIRGSNRCGSRGRGVFRHNGTFR